jgi:DNA-binding SARP family transcriptional activator
LSELRKHARGLTDREPQTRQRSAHAVLDFVRGDYLSEFRYEEWARTQQHRVGMDLRRVLMPVAAAAASEFEVDVRLRAASTLLKLDPFDDGAVLALAAAMEGSGKRVAARDLVLDYAERLRAELDDEPSGDVAAAVDALGGRGQSRSI